MRRGCLTAMTGWGDEVLMSNPLWCWQADGMCGRYAATKNSAALAVEFDAVEGEPDDLTADYNVAPTKRVHVVLDRELEGSLTRMIEVARWGLIPSWAKDASIGSRMINARAETVAEKPAFRRAFAKRRCLVPADGYYEWYRPTVDGAPSGRTGKPLKQPFYIHRVDGGSLAMAGLYEWWREPVAAVAEESDAASDVWRLTCTVITTNANDDLGRIHDRMPVILDRDRWSAWLDPTLAADEAQGLLTSAGDVRLEAYPVSTRVNNVRNNGPELIAPVEAALDGHS